MQPLLQGEAISVTYTECVFVALGMQHAMRVSQIVRLHNTFLHFLINDTVFGKS